MGRFSLPGWALAFAAGVWLSSRTGGIAHAPLLWTAGAAAFALLIGWRGWMAIAVCAGAALASASSLESPGVPPGAGSDDRVAEWLEGEVGGPIELGPSGARFPLLVEGGAVEIFAARDRVALGVLPGDRVRVSGRLRTPRGYLVPGAPDAAAEAKRRGFTYTMSIGAVEIAARGWSPWRWPAELQQHLSAAIAARAGDADGNAVVRAMVIGDRSGVSEEVAGAFRRSGTSHVLSVSGLHLAAVTWLVFALAARGWARTRLALWMTPQSAAAWLSLPVAVAYALVTGAQPATLRALAVAALILLGKATDRHAQLTDTLAAAAALMLALDPDSLWDPSLQLSFAAVLALAVTPPLRRGRRGLPARVVSLLRATVIASLATAPIAAYHFGEVATLGAAANLVVVPVAEVLVLPLGLAGAALAEVWPAAGGVFIDLAVWAAGWAVRVAMVVGATLPVSRPPPLVPIEAVAVFLLWWATLSRAVRVRWRVAVAAVAAAVVFATEFWLGVWLPQHRQVARVWFLDVGQGDAALIEAPGGAHWLVDAGGLPFVVGARTPAERAAKAAAPGRAILRLLARQRIARLDVVVVSHPHPDHYEGLRALVGAVEIGELWVTASTAGLGDGFGELARELAERGTVVKAPPLGVAARAGGAELEVLWPRYSSPDTSASDPVLSLNDNSLVVALRHGGRRVLFAGDLEAEGEELLIAEGGGSSALAADVVKVPHHGSRTSSSAPFVRAISPRLAVISCGVANRFNFPAPEVEERWRSAGAAVLRTDALGTILVELGPGGELHRLELRP